MKSEQEKSALALTEQLRAHAFDAVVARFDATMKSALPAAKLAEVWTGIERGIGAPGAVERVTSEPSGAYTKVIVTCPFGSTRLDLRWAFDAEGRVAGFLATPTPHDWAPPPYVNADAIEERAVTIGEGPWQLPATLTLPVVRPAPFAAVVLVHGSGPQDRDESIGGARPFKDLAQGLASRGIAALRYEKRTKEHAAKYAQDPAALAALTLDGETVDDAVLALELLRRSDGIDPARLFVVGHSLGAFAAPRIAERAAGLAGLVLLAPNARPLPDVMIEQAEYLAALDDRRSPEEKAQLAGIKEAAQRVRAIQAGAAAPEGELILGASVGYWRALGAYDPLKTARKLTLPMLLLRGQRDYQVGHADFELWKGAIGGRTGVELRELAGLNHLFVAGTGKSGPEEYGTEGHVDPAVIEAVAAFIARR